MPRAVAVFLSGLALACSPRDLTYVRGSGGSADSGPDAPGTGGTGGSGAAGPKPLTVSWAKHVQTVGKLDSAFGARWTQDSAPHLAIATSATESPCASAGPGAKSSTNLSVYPVANAAAAATPSLNVTTQGECWESFGLAVGGSDYWIAGAARDLEKEGTPLITPDADGAGVVLKHTASSESAAEITGTGYAHLRDVTTVDNSVVATGWFFDAPTINYAKNQTPLTSAGERDCVVVRLSSTITATSLGDGGFQECWAVAASSTLVAVGGYTRGSITVPGTTLTPSGESDAFVIGLDTALKPTWGFALGASNTASIRDIAISSGDGVLAVGTFMGKLTTDPTVDSGSVNHAVVVSLDSAGKLVWLRSFGGDSSNVASAVTALGDRIYVGGSINGNSAHFGGTGVTYLDKTSATPVVLELTAQGDLLRHWLPETNGLGGNVGSLDIRPGDGWLSVTGTFRGSLQLLDSPFETSSDTDYDAFVAIIPTL